MEAGAQRHLGTIRRTLAGQPRGAPCSTTTSSNAPCRTALRTGGELAEIFVEDKASSNAIFDDGKVENLSSGRDRGAGIRVIVGDTTGLRPHRRPVAEPGLAEAAEAAGAAARSGGGGVVEVALTRQDAPRPNDIAIYPEDVAKATQGRPAPPGRRHRPRRRARPSPRSPPATATAAAGSSSPTATASSPRTTRCARSSRSWRWPRATPACRPATSRSAARSASSSSTPTTSTTSPARPPSRALLKLAARPAPSGTMPVVIGPGGGGVLFHEACGHGLEADLVAKGASVFAGRVGERVADPRITLVDDGTMAEEWGAFAVDDEGSLAQRNVLIEDGILTDYMYDLLRSRKEGRARSGNGRRQSYKHLPMVRMTNTYVLAGPDEPDDIIAGTPDGVYVAHLGGGQVNTATGDFVFGMTEAYLIEDGQITEPIREGNLIGNGPAVLASIDAVGHDFAMGSPGMCGKDGQGVPVGDGVPTLRVPALTVGGTA